MMTEFRSERGGGRQVRNREHLRTENPILDDKDAYFTQKMKEFKHY